MALIVPSGTVTWTIEARGDVVVTSTWKVPRYGWNLIRWIARRPKYWQIIHTVEQA